MKSMVKFHGEVEWGTCLNSIVRLRLSKVEVEIPLLGHG